MTAFIRTICATFVAALIAAGCGGTNASSSASGALVDIGSGIRGVEGLHATVYASGLKHAAAFAFDTEDRLWVATASYSDDGTDGVYLVAASGAAAVEPFLTGIKNPVALSLATDGAVLVGDWTTGTIYGIATQ